MNCDPKEAALKSFFLGPQAENAESFRRLLSLISDHYIEWRHSQYPNDGRSISHEDLASQEFHACISRFEDRLLTLLQRFESEVPKFSPRYIGHMFSEISLPALLGHFVCLMHNPNNISSDVSRVGSQIEREAIRHLNRMIDYPLERAEGHFTSGGTLANFEALLRARDRMYRWLAAMAHSRKFKRHEKTLFESAHAGWQAFDQVNLFTDSYSDLMALSLSATDPFIVAERLNEIYEASYRNPVILVPHSKHYSWVKSVSLMGLSHEALWPIELDVEGKMDVSHLKTLIERAKAESRPILMVVSIAGTTELGEIDPIHHVQDLLDEIRVREGIHIWHHVDAAYGGFFTLASSFLSPPSQLALRAIARSDSVTIDPHKLGYVPYSSGAFLCREPRDYEIDPIDAPYVFEKGTRVRGSFTIEGSRSAAGASATWLTAETVGLDNEGYGKIIGRTVLARAALSERLSSHPELQIVPNADTNILCFCVARCGDELSEVNRRTRDLFNKLSRPKLQEIYVSKTILSVVGHRRLIESFVAHWNGILNHEEIFMIRLCLMNPFFMTKESSVNFLELVEREIWKSLTE